MVRPLLVKERLMSSSNASRTVILTSKTDIAVEERRFSKMQNWRHYLSKTRVKIKKNWHDHWEWLNKPFQNASKPQMGMIQNQGNWVPYELKPRDVEWRLFACEQLLERQRRKGFLHRILGTKNGFITIIPSAENHGEFPAMLPRRWPNRIFTAPRSCSVFGSARRSVLWTVKTDWNNHRRSVSNAMRLSRALKDKRPQYNERHDKVILQYDNARPHVAKMVKTYLETLNGKSYPTRRILQTLLPLTITCFDQWHTAWLTSTSGLMKK